MKNVSPWNEEFLGGDRRAATAASDTTYSDVVATRIARLRVGSMVFSSTSKPSKYSLGGYNL